MPRATGLQVINNRLGTSYASIAEATKALELPFLFAFVEQWRRNTQGPGVEDEPRLHNLSPANPRYDTKARKLLVGHLRDSKDPKGAVKFWKTLVPAWAPAVRDQLNKAGIPFSIELLQDADVNLDGNPPLFAGDANVTSLSQLGVNQKGERGYLRSLGADTLMLEVWPPYYRQHHRKAGEAAPYPQGLTFGAPYYDVTTGTYLRSPLMSTPSYAAWSKAGQPD